MDWYVIYDADTLFFLWDTIEYTIGRRHFVRPSVVFNDGMVCDITPCKIVYTAGDYRKSILEFKVKTDVRQMIFNTEDMTNFILGHGGLTAYF